MGRLVNGAMSSGNAAGHRDVLIVGAGQPALGTACWLTHRTDLNVRVVDAGPDLGSSWASRWDSPQLFTPRRFSTLLGCVFAAGAELPEQGRDGGLPEAVRSASRCLS
jgi:cation diffusion facilitator CzcD-associated flavoprotein CzcO